MGCPWKLEDIACVNGQGLCPAVLTSGIGQQYVDTSIAALWCSLCSKLDWTFQDKEAVEGVGVGAPVNPAVMARGLVQQY